MAEAADEKSFLEAVAALNLEESAASAANHRPAPLASSTTFLYDSDDTVDIVEAAPLVPLHGSAAPYLVSAAFRGQTILAALYAHYAYYDAREQPTSAHHGAGVAHAAATRAGLVYGRNGAEGENAARAAYRAAYEAVGPVDMSWFVFDERAGNIAASEFSDKAGDSAQQRIGAFFENGADGLLGGETSAERVAAVDFVFAVAKNATLFVCSHFAQAGHHPEYVAAKAAHDAYFAARDFSSSIGADVEESNAVGAAAYSVAFVAAYEAYRFLNPDHSAAAAASLGGTGLEGMYSSRASA